MTLSIKRGSAVYNGDLIHYWSKKILKKLVRRLPERCLLKNMNVSGRPLNHKFMKDLTRINTGEYSGERFLEVIGGLDVGYRDDNVFVVIGNDGDNYYILDEYISKESTTSELASAIQDKIDEWNIDTIYIDSAAQQVKADFAYDYDIYCENAIKSVNDGINYIQVLVEKDRLIL